MSAKPMFFNKDVKCFEDVNLNGTYCSTRGIYSCIVTLNTYNHTYDGIILLENIKAFYKAITSNRILNLFLLRTVHTAQAL